MSLCSIIGMDRRIGLSIAERFAREKYDIAMVSPNIEDLRVCSSAIRRYGVETFYNEAALGDLNQLEDILNGFNVPDVLVYNLENAEKSSLETIDPEKIITDFKVNVVGAMISARNMISRLNGKEGTIFFMGSRLGYNPDPEYLSLGIGKAGLLNFKRTLTQNYPNVHAVNYAYSPDNDYNIDHVADKLLQIHKQPKSKWEHDTDKLFG